MLVDTDKLHIIFREQFLRLRAKPRIDAELGLVPRGHHLFTVAGADPWVEAEGDASAAVDASETLQLGERVGADEYPPVDAVTQFVGGDVVPDIKYLVAAESGVLKDKYLAMRHRVGAYPLFADYVQQRDIGIRLDGKAWREASVKGVDKLAAPLPQDILTVDIDRRTEFPDYFKSLFVFQEHRRNLYILSQALFSAVQDIFAAGANRRPQPFSRLDSGNMSGVTIILYFLIFHTSA